MFPLLLELVYKLLSTVATEYMFNYLCTDYLNSLIEFVQAYITVIDLVRDRQGHRRPP